jgi:hypothetical protein
MCADRAATWDLDNLPRIPEKRIVLAGTMASICWMSFAIWVPFLMVVLIASIALEMVKYWTGRWTVPLAAMNKVLTLAFAIPAIWLATTEGLMNSDFVAAVATAAVPAGGGSTVDAHCVGCRRRLRT